MKSATRKSPELLAAEHAYDQVLAQHEVAHFAVMRSRTKAENERNLAAYHELDRLVQVRYDAFVAAGGSF
jgi:hypothetical protein